MRILLPIKNSFLLLPYSSSYMHAAADDYIAAADAHLATSSSPCTPPPTTSQFFPLFLQKQTRYGPQQPRYRRQRSHKHFSALPLRTAPSFMWPMPLKFLHPLPFSPTLIAHLAAIEEAAAAAYSSSSSSSSSSYGGGGYRRQAVKLPILALLCTPPPHLAAAVTTTPTPTPTPTPKPTSDMSSSPFHARRSCADDELLWLLSAGI
jgi:hypothetical protein